MHIHLQAFTRQCWYCGEYMYNKRNGGEKGCNNDQCELALVSSPKHGCPKTEISGCVALPWTWGSAPFVHTHTYIYIYIYTHTYVYTYI